MEKKRQGGGEEKGDHVGGEIKFGSAVMQDPFVTISIKTKVGGDGTCMLQQSGCLHGRLGDSPESEALGFMGWVGMVLEEASLYACVILSVHKD